jgi:DNA-binding MarR family transcriptional regulator
MATQSATDLDAAFQLVLDRMRRVFHARLRALELTPPQGLSLRLLSGGPMPMGALADLIYCDASVMTGIADRLEERGLVERQADPADRRVKLLSLTVNGRGVLGAMDRPLGDELPGMSALDDDERHLLATLLTKVFQ